MGIETNIPTEVVLLVIALASKKGKIQRFSEATLYRVFQKLTEEFPDYFQGLHWHLLPTSGFPYCGAFEDILFRSAGCLERAGIRMNEFVIEGKTIKEIEERGKKHHCEDIFVKMEPVVDRFIELYSKS